MVKVNLSVSFQDDRGKIIDLVENEEINAVTIITFKKGRIRGNHYHKQTIQWNYIISGKIKLVTQNPSEGIVDTILEIGECAVTYPNERHALLALEDSELLVLTKGPRGGKEYESDTFRLEAPLIQ